MKFFIELISILIPLAAPLVSIYMSRYVIKNVDSALMKFVAVISTISIVVFLSGAIWLLPSFSEKMQWFWAGLGTLSVGMQIALLIMCAVVYIRKKKGYKSKTWQEKVHEQFTDLKNNT